MGSHNPFRPACGSGCVHDAPDIGAVHHEIRFFRRGVGQKILITHVTIRYGTISHIDVPVFRNGQVFPDAVDQFHKRCFYHDGLTFRMVDDVFNVRPSQSKHDGDNHLATFGAAGVHIHPLSTVECDDSKGILMPHAHIVKSVGKPAGSIIPFFEREFLGFILPPQLVGIINGIHFHHCTRMHPFANVHDNPSPYDC